MGLFQNDAKREHASAGESGLLRFARDNQQSAAGLRGIQNRRMRDLSDLSDEQRSMDRLYAADAAQSAPGLGNTAQSVSDNGLRRARGLARVSAASGDVVNDQAFRDRVGIGRLYEQRRNRAISPLAQAGAADFRARQERDAVRGAKSQAKYNFLGGLSGMALNAALPGVGTGLQMFKDRFFGPKVGLDSMVDAPSGLGAPDFDYELDPYNLGQGSMDA